MPKKKKVVKKNIKNLVSVFKPKKKSSLVWYIIGALVLLGLLFLVYNGMTGNAVITGNVPVAVETGWNDYLKPILEYLLGWDIGGDIENTYKFNDYFSMALLLLVIVFSVVFVVVKTMPLFNKEEYFWATWVVSIAVSLLSVRFLSAEWLITILLPYSTLGVAISAGFPFVLFYFLVEKVQSKTLKKIFWFFFGIVFIYLWWSRAFGENKIIGDAYYEIYFWTALAAAFMALFGQRAFEKVKKKIKKEKGESSARKKTLLKKANDLHEQQQHYRHRMDSFTVGSSEYIAAERKHSQVTEALGRVYAELDALGG